MALKAGYKGIRETFVDFLTGKLKPEGIAGKLSGGQVDVDSSLAADSTTGKLGVVNPTVFVAKKTGSISTQGLVEVEFDLPEGITSDNTAFNVGWSATVANLVYYSPRAFAVNDTTHKLIASLYNSSSTATSDYICYVTGVKIS